MGRDVSFITPPPSYPSSISLSFDPSLSTPSSSFRSWQEAGRRRRLAVVPQEEEEEEAPLSLALLYLSPSFLLFMPVCVCVKAKELPTHHRPTEGRRGRDVGSPPFLLLPPMSEAFFYPPSSSAPFPPDCHRSLGKTGIAGGRGGGGGGKRRARGGREIKRSITGISFILCRGEVGRREGPEGVERGRLKQTWLHGTAAAANDEWKLTAIFSATSRAR